MRFGLSPFGHTRSGSLQVADLAHAGGVSRFWLGEGLLEVDAFPRWAGGMEPITWLAYLAGRYDGVEVALGATVLPLRDIAWLAKQIATLDQLTEGRFLLVATPGFWRREFEFRGLDFDRRGAAFAEGIEALRAALDGRPYESPNLRFPGTGRLSPAPYTPGGPSLRLAGGTATLNRALRLGLGFQARRARPVDVAPIVSDWFERGGGTFGVRVPIEIAEAVPDRRDDGATGDKIVGPAEYLAEQIAAYAELGVDDLSVIPGQDDATAIPTTEALVTEILPSLQGIVA